MAQQLTGFKILIALVILAGTVAAQDEASPTRNELAGIFGATIISDQGVAATGTNIHFGRGYTFNVDYGRRLRENEIYSVTAEVPVLLNFDEKLNYVVNVIPHGYKSYFITPSLRANLFPRTYISPWASFGVGFGHFSESSTLEFGGLPNPGKTGTTGAVIQAGLGLDVRITHTLSLRTEGRDFWSPEPQLNVDTGKTRQHNFFVGSGVIWHF